VGVCVCVWWGGSGHTVPSGIDLDFFLWARFCPSNTPHPQLPGTQPPHPCSAFHFFSPLPQKSRVGVGGDESCQGGPERLETGSQESFILVVIILTVGETGGRKPDH
jgi:hypothetical protein